MRWPLLVMIALIMGTYNLAFAEFPAVEVYENTSRNVVLILGRNQDGAGSVGAGSVISGTGMIITNAHVVFNADKTAPFENITVYLKPEKVTGRFKDDLVNRHSAVLKAYDNELDLAVLEVRDLPGGIGTVMLADPEEIKTGEEVVAIGHPENGGLWTLSYGRISGAVADQNDVKGKDVYQTDASVNRGNSGGPLLDRRGYMVGINTNIARVGAGNLPITGVNFAIKSSVIKKWLDERDIRLEYGSKPLNETQKYRADKVEENKTGTATGDRILTPKKPYSYDDLFKQTEEELDDMMKEMRGKIRSKSK